MQTTAAMPATIIIAIPPRRDGQDRGGAWFPLPGSGSQRPAPEPRAPERGGDDRGGLPESFVPGERLSTSPVDAAAQKRAEQALAGVREWYSSIGVKASEGNGGTVPVFDEPDFDNAMYAASVDPRTGEVAGAESVHIGFEPRSGRSYTGATDVIAHEWAHRIVADLAPGLARKEFGVDSGLAESIADTFAAAYDAGDWTLGEDVGRPIRDMSNPRGDGAPAHVKDLLKLARGGHPLVQPVRNADGVTRLAVEGHLLAGIPNKAASLLGDAIGRDKMAQVYLKTARDYLEPRAGLEGYAAGVMQATADLFGADSHEALAAEQAWDAVGVLDMEQSGVRLAH